MGSAEDHRRRPPVKGREGTRHGSVAVPRDCESSARMNASLTSEATWVPRVTLVTALMAAVSLPWAHHLGSLGPFLVGIGIVLLGVTGFFWSIALRELVMAGANLVVGLLAVPAVAALVALAGGT